MKALVITEELVYLGLEAGDWRTALTALAERLHQGGYVLGGFTPSLLQREAAYPTGLPTVIPVALCHTDAKWVAKSALAVGVLAEPVAFYEMGAPDQVVWVEIVFLLALKDPKTQVAMLQRFTRLLKNGDALELIRSAATAAEVTGVLSTLL
jgi:PTS system galactitol-specific IIA component